VAQRLPSATQFSAKFRPVHGTTSTWRPIQPEQPRLGARRATSAAAASRPVLDIHQELLSVGAPVTAPDPQVAARRPVEPMKQRRLEIRERGPGIPPTFSTYGAASSSLPRASNRRRSMASGRWLMRVSMMPRWILR